MVCNYKMTKSHLSTLFCVLLLASATPSISQDEGFADDFTQNSFRYNSTVFSNSTGTSSISTAEGVISLRADGTGDGTTFQVLEVNDTTSNRFIVTAGFDPSTTLNGEDSSAEITLDAKLYNDTASSIDADNDNGDIRVLFTIRSRGANESAVIACFDRFDGNGGRDELRLFENGTDHCVNFDATINIGQNYTYGFIIDRDSGQIELMFDDQSTTVQIDSEMHDVVSPNTLVHSSQRGTAGSSVVNISAVESDSLADDFAGVNPVLDRYNTRSERATRSVTHANGRVEMRAASVIEGNGEGTNISAIEVTDYLESTVVVSSNSIISSGQQSVNAGFDTIWANDISDGGLDGRTGDIRATIDLRYRANGTRSVEYCLSRAIDPDFNEHGGLLEDGERCDTFPVQLEIDVPYRVAIALDRPSSTYTFMFEGFSRNVSLDSTSFQASRFRNEIQAESNNLGTAIVYIDDLRTLKGAVTPTEASAGLLMAPEFPEEPDAASLVADSTIEGAFDFYNTEPVLDFVDDFSRAASTQFGFWGGRTRGESSVEYVNGAIELRTNSAEGNLEGNYTEFYVHDESDSIMAEVSLSSDSNLPVDPDAQATVSIRAVFHNDTQDFGFSDEVGDYEFSLQIRLRGDGRRVFDVDGRRREEGGSSTSLRLYDVVSLSDIYDALVPELDTVYTLGIRIDRERQVIVFSVDDTSAEYQLPTEVFLAARPFLLLSVNHNGSSGRAVGRWHSISTESTDENFLLEPPVIAPYRPGFNARYAGIDRDIVDGRLRLSGDGAITEGRDPRITALGASDYVSAIVELSSESVLPDADDEVFIGVHGQLYNDTETLPNGEGLIGEVFSTVRLTQEGSGSPYVQYCAWRSNVDDFSDATQLIGNDPSNCPRFSIVPQLDTPYFMSVELDRDNAMVLYTFDSNTIEYPIATEIFSTSSPFNGVRARTSPGAKVVAFADDLSFSENAVPLEDSSVLLAQDDQDVLEGSPTSSGGGCSIAGASGSGLPLLLGGAILVHFIRRKRVRLS